MHPSVDRLPIDVEGPVEAEVFVLFHDDEVFTAALDHGRRLHNMDVTREQVEQISSRAEGSG